MCPCTVLHSIYPCDLPIPFTSALLTRTPDLNPRLHPGLSQSLAPAHQPTFPNPLTSRFAPLLSNHPSLSASSAAALKNYARVPSSAVNIKQWARQVPLAHGTHEKKCSSGGQGHLSPESYHPVELPRSRGANASRVLDGRAGW